MPGTRRRRDAAPSDNRSEPRPSPPRAVLHVAPADQLAYAAVQYADAALHTVLEERRPYSIKAGRSANGGAHPIWAWPDLQLLSSAVRSLFRWWGWIEPRGALSTAERLLLAHLLDSSGIDPIARQWARTARRPVESLIPLADAPSWTARTDGFKRNVRDPAPLVDPWALFPPWFRKEVPLPPGDTPPKQRAITLIQSLQMPPRLWVRAQFEPPEKVWNELREQGLKPWIHRRLPDVARLDARVEIARLPSVERGVLEIHDLAAQSVARIAAPQPGQRWWSISLVRPPTAPQLAAAMNGRGVVVASDRNAANLKSLALHLRRTPARNVTTRPWDGKHVAGKPGSFDGVVLTPPSSEIGLWRRFPDARWRFDPHRLPQLGAEQLGCLAAAALGVRPGGILVYAVPSFAYAETTNMISLFLEAHTEFALDPFPDPLTGASAPGTLTIWPHVADTDGWFIARLKRRSSG